MTAMITIYHTPCIILGTPGTWYDTVVYQVPGIPGMYNQVGQKSQQATISLSPPFSCCAVG